MSPNDADSKPKMAVEDVLEPTVTTAEGKLEDAPPAQIRGGELKRSLAMRHLVCTAKE